MISNNIVKELQNGGMSSVLGYTFYYHNSKLTVYKDGVTKSFTLDNLCPEAIEWTIARHVIITKHRKYNESISCSM